MTRRPEPRMRGTLEGKGRVLDATAPGSLGVRGTAQLDGGDVRAEAVAYVVGSTVAMGGFPVLSLRLQAMTDSGGKLHGGTTPRGQAFALWEGTPEEARDLSGGNGPGRQWLELGSAIRRLERLRAEVETAADRERDKADRAAGPLPKSRTPNAKGAR